MPAKQRSRKQSNLPTKAKKKRAPAASVFPREVGPRKWLLPLYESAYTILAPRDEARPSSPAASVRGAKSKGFRSRLQPGEGENILAAPDQNFWLERLREYQERKAATALARGRTSPAAGAFVPGARNWTPLGPSVVQN